ncbi:NADH dehydrogenase [Emiliania huxleyi CCMP1516]|uniref:NADH:ubiquinone reductase (non-electrogenic) n=2 Tax=Emiliania huxleyi TaxID=2903 RepID=A0A0D3KUS3_EMIH1|nr:NADH dehydrogenase [Emiliania huxleyi CCMP1516]EOD39508.1 NADH dehydrogenase [Emiliania huxleyi CCMP1516]|eukprot:XP_005791937.1 NADH dehydrogenase [Emiliania huxleyi CCMP1516]
MLRRALLGGGGLAIALGILHRLSITQSNQPRCLCGWAGLSFVRKLDMAKYDLTIVSPRPYFFYTPLLTGSVTGTVHFHNILEPIRSFCTRAGAADATYVKASCEGVDLKK